ncbi:MAG: hypothetical protein RMK52_00930 [Chitinophagales bacterium]|nr:hypothetical protein [Chitinophagales bacterium]MDW8392789.1 hypothetical protein [Chitinophagales bacterium]
MNLLLILLLWWGARTTEELPVQQLRERYGAVLNKQLSAHQMLDWLRSSGGHRAIDYAYLGATEALMARDAWNPWTKWEYLQRSMATISRAVAMDPEDAEIRFLRFCIQHYVPAWLGMSDHLQEDRQHILAALRQQQLAPGDPLRQNIIRFLLESGRCTDAEEQWLTAQLR